MLERLVLLVPIAIAFVSLSANSLSADDVAHSNAGSRHHGGGGMEQVNQPASRTQDISRRTLRLTIKTSAKGLELIAVEHLPMITPPQPGERPVAGTHSGHWFELRDAENRVLAHRLIDDTLLNSVEVHSPDGKIQRVFGELRDTTFEVLLPDVDGARFAVFVGDPIAPTKTPAAQADARRARSGEITRFDLSQVRK
jgi:hypothetical protein